MIVVILKCLIETYKYYKVLYTKLLNENYGSFEIFFSWLLNKRIGTTRNENRKLKKKFSIIIYVGPELGQE